MTLNCLLSIKLDSKNIANFYSFNFLNVLIGNGYSGRERNIGIQAPPLTKLVKSILQRYPEGGQILKVHVLYFSFCLLNDTQGYVCLVMKVRRTTICTLMFSLAFDCVAEIAIRRQVLM